MKLIIDIEDEALERLSTADPNLLYTAIKNGTPYEERPQGDLISREALKKTIKDSDIIHCFANLWYADILKEIDNAPTVAKDYDTGYQDGLEDGLNDIRPQGKWIFMQGVTCGGYYKCNKCGEVERAEKNYCPNCGADMRGKEE